MICKKIFLAPPRLMVADGAFSHKIDYVKLFQEILNPERHPNHITGNFAEWWILPIGGVSSGRVCARIV